MSWLPRAGGEAYWVYFNRDERRTRGPARPPTRHERDGVAFVAPTDSDAGGTWIGVNQHGVTVGLLNRYHESPVDPDIVRVSRGLLVLALLTSRSATAMLESLAGRSLRAFQPFTVVGFDRNPRVAIADWTGAELVTGSVDRPGLVRTSSGRDQLEAERVRAGALAALTADAALSPEILDRFHRSHWPDSGPFSACMHREEAETQSLTIVTVSGADCALAYAAGPPHLEGPAVTARLTVPA